MKALRNGIVAGCFATMAVSMLMMVKAASHQFPELHVIRTLSGVVGNPDNLIVGFGAHLFVGVVIWGGLFALLASRIPARTYLVKGLMFGAFAWLLMMTIFMPLAGAGFFAANRGAMAVPLVTLLYHLVFGIVLGYVYGSNMPVVRATEKKETGLNPQSYN